MANQHLSHGRLAAIAGLLALAFAADGAIAAPAPGKGTTDADAAGARAYTYRTLDYPGASLTIFWGLDDLGRMAGQYAVAGGESHAMIYANGKFKPLDPDDLGAHFSAAGGPNDAGTKYGAYADASGLQHGFTIRRGRFETVDFPGHLNSNVDGADVFGSVLGVTWEADGIFHGVLRQDGSDTPIDVEGARDTYPLGLNSQRESVGYWDIDPLVTHGYLRAADGTITTLDVPGAASTVAFAINERHQVGGYYTDTAGMLHGFVKTGAKFQDVDMPGAVATVVTTINNWGNVAGEYFDATGARHGFLATLK
jgi:hypothetical protein